MKIQPELRAVLDCLDDPAILLSNEYRILMANDAYERVYGDGQVLRRRHCYEVSHQYNVPCDLAGELCPLKASRESRQPTRVLHVHHTPRGQEYVNVETRPVFNENGSIDAFIEIMKPSHIANTKPGRQGLVGKSRAFQAMVGKIDRVATSETSVLLVGETGTGKELAAQTIHERSARAAGPFVPVECAGLTESLFESELFGHAKGAFTGALNEKTGLVEAADGGTLFLDEIGEIPLNEQVKLLRLLETRQFRRVGSIDARDADFRLVCATNRDLDAMVEAGTFRHDLLFRLNVFEIDLPPLRQRHEDLPILIESMLERLGKSGTKAFAPETMDCLATYPFPGNVRELRNVVERALLMCDGDTVLPDHLPDKYCRQASLAQRDSEDIRTLADVERDYLRRALVHYNGDRRGLAVQLGISERALYRKIAALRTASDAS